MTRKQQVFVAQYLVDKNATKAAIRAGYSKKSAGVQGHELLKKPEIHAAIEKKLASHMDRVGITVDEVLNGLKTLAFFDARKFYNEDGTLKNVTELDQETANALMGMDVEQAYEHFGKGQSKPTGTVKKFKFADRGVNLERLGRYLKMFTDRVEVSGLDKIPDLVEEARQRVLPKKAS